MGFVGPLVPRQGTREQAFADMLDLGVGVEGARSVFGHWIGSCREARSEDRAKRVWLVPAFVVALVARPWAPLVGHPRPHAPRIARNSRRKGRRAWPRCGRTRPCRPRCCADREWSNPRPERRTGRQIRNSGPCGTSHSSGYRRELLRAERAFP